MTIFNTIHFQVIRFCSIECELQMSGERSVYYMLVAWEYAANRQENAITKEDILILGKIVEPKKNRDGYRQCAVFVGKNEKMPYPLVSQAMDSLLERQNELEPESFFYEYENIHPFVDGNGRTGQILYNWLKHTLHDPIWAPNFWSDPRRKSGDGAPIEKK